MERSVSQRLSDASLRQELKRLSGRSVVLQMMLSRNLPLTREVYMALAMPDVEPEDWGTEDLDMKPEPLREQPT